MSIFGWSYPAGCSGPPEDNYDDTVCYNCGAELPEYPEDGTPEFDGFCCKECMDGKPTPVIMPMYKMLLDFFSANDWNGIKRSIYKYTDCGACIMAVGSSAIVIGSIVEGADVDAESQELTWPFTEEDIQAAIDEVEASADEIWHEWNV